MKVVQLSLRGTFEDAWFYKDRLLLWTTNGQTLEAPVGNLAATIREVAPGSGVLPELLFARNDWKSTALFEAMVRAPSVASALNSLFRAFPQPPIDLKVDELFEDVGVEQYDGTLLDVNVYFDRFYLSTTSGLYDVDIDWEDQEIAPVRGLRHRLAYRCVGASTGYGLVNASCEDDGLFTGFDDFGWARNHALRGFDNRTLRQTDEQSVRTSWLGSSLLNYRGAEGPSFIRSASQPSSKTAPRDVRNVIVDYSRERYDLHSILFLALREAMIGRPGSLRDAVHEWLGNGDAATLQAPTDFRIVTNAGNNVVVESADSRVGLVRLRTGERGPPEVRSVQPLGQEEERVMSVGKVRSGLVLESESAVELWGNSGITRLVDGEAVRVRTFPNSIRYRDLVVVILDHSVILVGLYDDAPATDG